MATPVLFYIGTSKVKEIRVGASVTFDWGSYSSWTAFKSPVKSSQKKVKYSKTAKNKAGASKYGGAGGVTKLGTRIPATATRIISGVSRVCDVRYYQRGYTKYTRTAELKKKNKMSKTVYTKDKPYQYRLQYKDKPVTVAAYSKYEDGVDYIYFADHYWSNGEQVATEGQLPHPVRFDVSYSDVMKNFDSSAANNSDNRDNKGTFVLSNVRANVVTLSIEWAGMTKEQGADLLDTLNPSKDSKGKYNYLIVQYMDPATGEAKNKTFYASSRSCEILPNGCYRSISVTLTEV